MPSFDAGVLRHALNHPLIMLRLGSTRQLLQVVDASACQCYSHWLPVQAALDAPLPAGCSRTVYLCDDGKNKQKRKWCLGRAPEVVYVSGRQRPKGEMNGKSANLNNCLRQIYPENAPVPANEIVCIFDADQVRLLSVDTPSHPQVVRPLPQVLCQNASA